MSNSNLLAKRSRMDHAKTSPRAPWQPPRLVCLGDLTDVAGSPAPLIQINPGGNPVSGKS